MTKDEFVNKSNMVHNNYYNYSLVEYINNKTSIKIICPKHGEFEQISHNHLAGKGCVKCGRNKTTLKQTMSKEKFIENASKIHNNLYDYSQVVYINTKTKIDIICKTHGVFKQTPNSHLNGHGCIYCRNKNHGDSKKKSISSFIELANKIHNNKYDYSKSIYKGRDIKILIICKIHGDFLQYPKHHLIGSGCQLCKKSKGETKIENYLKNKNINYIPQKTFNECKGRKNMLPFDFYLPLYNVCIEYDGKQHISGWNDKKESLEDIQRNDQIKNNFCVLNKIDLIRIPYTQYDQIEKLLNSYFLLSRDISTEKN